MNVRLIAATLIIGIGLQSGGCVSTALQIAAMNVAPASDSSIMSVIPLTEETSMIESQMIFDFGDPAALAAWTIVNDGVMGGVSQSAISASETGTMVFAGIVSFENNGGFASTQTYFFCPARFICL